MGKSRQIIPQPKISREAMRDFICASSVIFIIGAAMYIYFLGERGGEIGGAIVAALAGAAIAEWSKFGLSGRHLTVSEFLQDVFVSGFIAVSSCPAVLLKPPAAWSDLLFMNSTVAAIVLAIYHASNLYHLAALRQHLSKTFGIAIIAPPYLIGWLLLLESPSLLQSTWLPATESLGRVLVVFLFNEAVVNGLGMAMRRVYRISMKAHLLLLGVAITAVAGPWIAQIGSSGPITGWPLAARGVVAVLTTLLSQAGLWAEVYLITGIFLEALYGKTPSRSSLFAASFQGVKKGMIYSGIFMGILHGANLLWHIPLLETLMDGYSFSIAALFGAATFPLAKTIIETFDGSHGFFRRVQMSYRDLALYLRGAVIGLGLDYAIFHSMAEEDVSVRVKFGLAVGIAAFAGVSLLRDSTHALRHHERLKWRAYLLEMIWGGLIGAAIGFYLDAAQLAIVAEKFQRYVSLSHMPEPFGVYPFLSKWGFIRLGNVTGGVSLLFNEALAGVICWSVPAWLFALNRTFLTAAFRRETTPMKLLFTHAGFVGVTHNMLEVLRWGLWMSPIINSFLRPMGEPTWYNQDGAIHTLAAIFQNATSSPEDFRAWSLHVFILLLAYDSVRILIWLDHMGLRVATLVNLSFLGMDKLDERLTRFLGSTSSSRCIPESVKRFATWAPLLIPYYIPRGKDWDIAWSRSEALQKAAGNGNLASSLSALPLLWQFMLGVVAILSCTALFAFVRWLRRRFKNPLNSTWELRNSAYSLSLHANGEIIGQSQENGYDLSRRCYDFLDPAGRALFVVDVQQDPHDPARAWPALGNFPSRYGKMPQIEFRQDSLVFRHAKHGIATTVEISLPDEAESAELWTITLENTTNAQRQLKVVPYLEWVLNRPDADRNHTQYNRLFAELEYCEEAHAILARDKHSNALGVLAADVSPQGFLTSRIDFIGRARNLWQPRILETLAFMPPEDEPSHPTFDPLGSLLLDATLRAGQSARFRLLMGMAKDKRQAIELISRTLGITCAKTEVEARSRKSLCAIRHGEIPAGIPQPYWSYSEDGRALLVHTPFTPRPFDHTLSNSLGHTVSVTNRGLHTSCNGNSQQNLLTPNWTDIVTREVPGEAFYLYDIDSREWYSPTFHPLNDAKADYQAEFRIDGTAIFRMTQATLATELTVFVPPQEPLGVYLLTVRNPGNSVRRIRLAPYFQIVLASQPEQAGPLSVHYEKALAALFFENPQNEYRRGSAFVAMSQTADQAISSRGQFFGPNRDVAHPFLVEKGKPAAGETEDARPIAGMLTTLSIPAEGECTIAVLLGQADDRRQAESLIQKYRNPAAARESLLETGKWWQDAMGTVKIRSSNSAFDHSLNWLKYQTLVERIWARRGFYQTSGAFGFRDQLQDAVNLLWMEPQLARRQILLHASQQFFEGDVLQWFHLLHDGSTGIAARNYASDPHLWLAWAAVEYVAATDDESLLDEQTFYVEAPEPLPPLPAGKHGMCFVPIRSSRTDTVYRHCMKSINLVLDHRMGAHGLPLMCCGDWNDGLDEIGSQGKGESVWLGFFLYYILTRMLGIIEKREGAGQKEHYARKTNRLKDSLELAWRGDRYLRAIHDDGTEIGVRGTGVWETDALTAAWAVIAGMDPARARTAFDASLNILEKEKVVLLGWPPLHEATKPFLGRSSWYPAGVRENGMYCHGVQWLIGAARILAERTGKEGNGDASRRYRETAYRLWMKISSLGHSTPEEIETYGGQPNKQAADLLAAFDPGRLIWNGYTGAAGWMFRQALEGVLGAKLARGKMSIPDDFSQSRGDLKLFSIDRDLRKSPLADFHH